MGKYFDEVEEQPGCGNLKPEVRRGLDRLRPGGADPGKVSGRALVKGTRIPADTIVEDSELGASVEEIHESFPSLPVELIEQLLAFRMENNSPGEGTSR